MRECVDQHVEAKAPPQRISVDVPCGRCASNLRGLLPMGQCHECGMDNAKSLGMAAIRCDDPQMLERLGLGLDVQAWGTVLAMLACVLGPWLSIRVSYDAFAVVVLVALSVIGCRVQRQYGEPRWRRRGRCLPQYLAPFGGVGVIVLAWLIRWQMAEPVGPKWVAGFLATAAVWFIAECHRLEHLKEVDSQMSMGALAVQARRLRWGISIAVVLLSLECALPLVGRPVPGYSLVTSAASLLVFTALTALLYQRSARRLRLEARVARFIRETSEWTDRRLMPDEPNWIV